jgi:membrane protease YdiL (CAAX protease family)
VAIAPHLRRQPDARIAIDAGRAAGLTLLVLIGGVAVSLAVALANQPWFELTNRWFGFEDPVLRGALYSSWLVLVAAPFVVRRPSAFGLRLGDVAQHWRLCAVVTVGAMAITAIILALVSATPYDDASWVNEVVIVPFSEELVFRGVILAALLAILGRIHAPSTAVVSAVVINAVVFGAAHATNLILHPASFVIPQMVFATVVLGIPAAYLAVRTRSIYPAMLLHAAINAVVVAS